MTLGIRLKWTFEHDFEIDINNRDVHRMFVERGIWNGEVSTDISYRVPTPTLIQIRRWLIKSTSLLC